jgi:hypothetical protein
LPCATVRVTSKSLKTGAHACLLDSFVLRLLRALLIVALIWETERRGRLTRAETVFAAVASFTTRGRFPCHFGATTWHGGATNSGGFVGWQEYGVCSAGETTEVFAVARALVEEGGDGLAVRRLQAFQLEGVHGGEIRGMDVVVGGDLVFGQTGRAPPAGAEVGAGTPSLSGDRGRRMLGRVRAESPGTPTILLPSASGCHQMNGSSAHGQRRRWTTAFGQPLPRFSGNRTAAGPPLLTAKGFPFPSPWEGDLVLQTQFTLIKGARNGPVMVHMVAPLADLASRLQTFHSARGEGRARRGP